METRPPGPGAIAASSRWSASRLLPVVCLAGVAYVALYAAIDAVLETHAETAHQMLIRLVVVGTALVGVAVLIQMIVRRGEESARLAQEEAERRVTLAQEEARLEGALLAMREFAPWLAQAANVAATTMSAHDAGATVADSAVHGEGVMLTPREREVALLIAQGRTSREIAEGLVITERTADTHADHIRAKLGLRSRAAIVAWVLGQGMPSSSSRRLP